MPKNNRLLSTFLDLVQIDSPTGFESAVAAWVVGFLNQHQISCRIDFHGNVLARLDGTDEAILLTAHMDTVEPGRGVKPKVSAGLIQSSGNTILGADNKVALAVILETLITLSENHQKHKTLEAIFTVSEESGNLGAVGVDLAKISATHGYSFDAAGELGTIITASPFYNRFDIRLSGKSAHAAHPEQAKNVLAILGPALSQLKFGWVNSDTIVNIGQISGGSVRNTIPGDLSLTGEIRSFTKDQLETATTHIISAFTESAKAAGITVHSEVVTENAGFKLASNHPAVTHAAHVLTRLGLNPRFERTFACFDANVFGSRGITVVNLSDGTQNNHTPAESVTVANLQKLAETCLNLVLV